MKAFYGVILCAITIPAMAEPVEKSKLGDYIEDRRERADERKGYLKERIQLAERGRVNRFVKKGYVLQELRGGKHRYLFASQDAKDKLLDQLAQELYRAANPDPSELLPSFDGSGDYPKGHVGQLPNEPKSYRVLEVVDDENLLLDVIVTKAISVGRGSNAALEKGTRRAYQAQRGRNSPALTVDTYSHTLWVQTKTDGLRDDQRFDPDGRLFLSVGTKRYQTGPGETTTVAMLKEIPAPGALDGKENYSR